MNNKKMLVGIFLVVFIDLLGFSLILPLLPFYAQTLGANPVVIGLLVSSYAAAQLIGAPLLGRLSDRYGRKPMLLISIFGTFIGFILLGIAQTLAMVFVARIFDGFTGGNISIAQAYITDITDRKNRAQGLGLIGAAFGLGFIIGPAFGGLLSQWGYQVPIFVAAALTLINFFIILIWVPESLSIQRRVEIAQVKRPPFTFKAMLNTLQRPYVGPLLHTRFFFALAFAAFQTTFALYGEYRFQMNALTIGYILAYVGLLSALVQGLAVGRLTKKFSDNQLILSATGLMAISLLGWAFAPNIPILLLVLIPTALSGGILNTVLSSALTKSVSPTEIGGTLGLSSALESLTRVIAPLVGGILLQNLGVASVGIISALILAWLCTYIWRYIYTVPPQALPEQV